jgi:hypothetical protein
MQAQGELVGAALVKRGRAVRGHEVFRAAIAEIGLRRAQVSPVGLRLHADAFNRNELALNAEESLGGPLGLLIATLPEMAVADDAFRADEVQRRPVVVFKGAPNRVVVVERNRVVDRALTDRFAHTVGSVLKAELGCVDPDHD